MISKRNRIVGAAVVLLACGARAAAPAVAPGMVTGAIPVVRETLSFAQEVAEVPKTAATVLYLPLGLLECVLSPLPGIKFGAGCRHIGQGVVAPFQFVEAVVTLPYDAVRTATGVVNAVPQAAGLGPVIPAP